MTRIYATPRKTLILDVVGPTIVRRTIKGRRTKATVRRFRNRYTLRAALQADIRTAQAQGFVSVNR